MKLKKIVAAIAAAAIAVSAMAVNAFAVDLDATYPGAWQLSAPISKADLTAIGGDVAITINYTLEAAGPYICAPSNAESWDHLADMSGTNAKFSSSDVVAKPDGFFALRADKTSATFVMSADAVAALGDTGLAFQVNNVTINSADLAAGTVGDEITRIVDGDTEAFNAGTLDPWAAPAAEEAAPVEEATDVEETEEEVEVADEEEAAPAVEEEAPAATEEAPAADTTTDAAQTGNTAAAAVVAVMAVAAVAAVATKKRK